MTLSLFRRSHRIAFASLLLLLSIAGGVVTYRIIQWRSVAFGFMNAQPQSSTNVIRAQARSGQEKVYALSIRCRGELDGIGAIALDGMSSEFVFSNKFDVQIRKRDWYSTNCNIVFTTTNVQTGDVVISYRFHD